MHIDITETERNLYKNGTELIVGIDEAGRGPLAGPVTVAAVIMKPGVFFLERDSKKYSEEKRKKLVKEIEKNALEIVIEHSYPEEIDSVNILQATKLAAERAIGKLKTKYQYIITDFIDIEKKDVGVLSIPKADETVHCVAAASIIAKVTRDELMNEYEKVYPEFSFSRHKGYPTKKHIHELKINGPTPIHRKSFIKKFIKEGK